MILSEFFQNLSFGELSNLSIGNDGSGEIPGAHQGRIIKMTNRSLAAIYSRFRLLTKEVIVDCEDHITLYYLQKKYAKSSPEPVEDTKYITDTASDPFLEDIIKILNVFDVYGEQQMLNDPTEETSLFTPKFDCLQVNQPVKNMVYFVEYQAGHPSLVQASPGVSSPVDLLQNIMLPVHLEPALQAHVSWQVLSGMAGPEHIARGQEQFMLFDMLCADIESRDLTGQSHPPLNMRFNERGWC